MNLQDLPDFCRRQGEYILRKQENKPRTSKRATIAHSQRYIIKIYQIKQPRPRTLPRKEKRFTRFIDLAQQENKPSASPANIIIREDILTGKKKTNSISAVRQSLIHVAIRCGPGTSLSNGPSVPPIMNHEP